MTALWPARPARPAEHRTATGHLCGPHRGRGRLIGRGAEMGRITAALAAARSGQGGALFVTGEPGIGKTRLATAALAAAASADMVTVRGRASTVGPPVPYRPLVEALLLLARAGLLPAPEELDGYGPVMTRLLGGTPGSAGRETSHISVAETMLRLLTAVGRQRGCLLVLDDLHDADAGTLAVVEYLLDNIGQQPAVLLLVAGRAPRAAAELARRARQREAAQILDLTPLSHPDVRLLVAAELDAAPAEVCPELLHRAVTGGAGIPFVVKELVHDHADHPVHHGDRTPPVPATVADDIRRRTTSLGPLGTEFLGTAALFGRRFPLPVLEHAIAADPTALSEVLRAALASSLITPDGPGTQWYAFHYPLAAQALLADLGPGQRARHARRAAHALARLHPGLPGAWRAHAARLHEHAGEPCEAVRLYCEAAQRAMDEGALERALELLTRAHPLLEPGTAPELHATVLELLLDAAARSGRLDRLPTPPAAGHAVPAARRAGIHARLSGIATLAGRPAEALHHLDTARALLPDHPADGRTALVDLAAAHAELSRPAPDRLHTAARLARRAVDAARGDDRPDTACEALLLLGRLARQQDEPAATAHFKRARAIALAHRLPVPRTAAEVQLALTEAGHDDRPGRLEQARQEAHRNGLLPLAHEVGFALAIERIRRGAYDDARDGIIDGTAEASRLGLGRPLALFRLADAVRYAHQGRRTEMRAALERLEPHLDAAPGLRPLSYGLARAFCSLLEERRDAAEQELAQALAHDTENPAADDFGRHGLALLLGVLAGRLGRGHCAGIAEAGAEGTRWNRQFAGLAHAVLLGREGHRERATAAADRALAAAGPYPLARRLCLRLVAGPAYEDGWGTPVEWLREAEEYFHGAGLHPVAAASRALLRGMGAPVRQRRTGTEQVPPHLRRSGITVREFEVARLVAERISNKDIAGRLHISLRTVEKHVANVLHKTGHPNRRAFATAARDLTARDLTARDLTARDLTARDLTARDLTAPA
ncbi:helix-turn-helix transcriptional regulator [Streptomyces yangpuensis]|uniref:helix-turn-helix transcriptional regulator n=1 Tax=Streptomyces yangpuensis TaxID=1648182 RepID=UPI002286AE03|nr:LuxR family transcriptional regulator [Streptomyces yangpuensis]